jgi:hypothetical protein
MRPSCPWIRLGDLLWDATLQLKSHLPQDSASSRNRQKIGSVCDQTYTLSSVLTPLNHGIPKL